MSSAAAAITSAPRVIRVFVSSTFRDMVEERNQLATHVFPALRRLCESRGVVWGEVDLRWGITEEQSQRGEVLPTCLDEIHRCRPYFIGLLGERYGWVPHAIPPQLIEREPWLKEHLHHSVTELEILHGVLNNVAMANHAFFYIRDPDYLKRLPAGAIVADYSSEDPAARAKLLDLKERIRRSGFPTRENYPDPKTLGELVLADMTRVIDQLFPEGTQPDPLDREGAEHEIFAGSRCVLEVRPGEKVGVYIGRREYIDRLDVHAVGDGPPLVVLGESGSGKTALLANWVHGYREKAAAASRKSVWKRLTGRTQAAPPFVLIHFIGATPASTDWMAMLRRILGEFNRKFDLRVEIPDNPDTLRATFANALSMVAARGRVILVLDGLNQLEDRDQAPDLVWLPPAIPSNIRFILSTLPGRPLDALEKRGWPTMVVQPLDKNERQKLIVDYLAQYRKQLSEPRVERIATAAQAANPLYLRALLEELRLWGDHDTLGDCIDNYLRAKTVDQLYGKILARYEKDYERERPGLVRDAMRLLWAARRGLSEAELRELLGSDGQPLSRAYWSPLYLAAEPSLVTRSGLIGFSHDYLREAVRDAYLPTAGHQQGAHHTLALYFVLQPSGQRLLDELPWQLQEAGQWQILANVLAQPVFFDALWDKDQFEVKAYWTRIEIESPLRMEQAYSAVIEQPARDPHHAWRIGSLLGATGKPGAALRVYGALVEHFREQGDRTNLQRVLGNRALILKARGDLDDAMALHQEEERLCRELGNKAELPASLGNQANIRYARGDLEGAMALQQEAERLCRELGDKGGLQATLNNQANILCDRENLDGAMTLCREAERLCRELGDKSGLTQTLGTQARILSARGDLDGAMTLLKEQERLCRELGDKDGLQVTLNNQASILCDRSDLDGAMTLCGEAERLCRELGNKDGLQAALGKQALVVQARGDLDGALALCKEAERLCRELGNKDELEATLSKQAKIVEARGDLDGAIALYKEAERLCRELGKKDGLQLTLGTQALIFHARGDLDGAMTLYKEVERLCRELGNKDRLSIALGNQAAILQVRKDFDGAMALHKEAERLCRELANKDRLSTVLGNQAVILRSRRDLEGAMALYKEHERLSRELSDEAGLLVSLEGQASILKDRGDLDGAMALYKEHERLCRELGNKDTLATTLSDLALILLSRGDADGALARCREAERLCRELGNKPGLLVSLGGQASILKARGDLGGAMTLYKEAERLCRELENKDVLATTLGGQALILQVRGDLDGAMALHKEAERLCRELENKTGLSTSLGSQAMIRQAQGDLDGAMALLKEQGRLRRELGDKDGLQRTLGNQANILYARKDLDGAMTLWKEQERLLRDLDNKAGLAISLGGQANVLCARGDLNGALALYKEQGRLCRELGNKAGLSSSLGNQANILYARGDLDGAMALYKEVERFSRELGKPEVIAISLANQAALLNTMPGCRREARRLADEALAIATRHGYRQLLPQFQSIRDSIPADAA